jgi:hypothetical protein
MYTFIFKTLRYIWFPNKFLKEDSKGFPQSKSLDVVVVDRISSKSVLAFKNVFADSAARPCHVCQSEI